MRQALGLLTAASLLAGCALPAHNNTLIFATKTDVGLGVSTPSATDAGVSVTLGYKERRAAWVPLWANGPDGKPFGCQEVWTLKSAPSEQQQKDFMAEVSCKKGPKLLGDDDAGGSKGDNARKDAYSTFASFGGDFGGSGSGGVSGGAAPQAQVSGKIASFFATGVAAQTLAKNAASVGLPPPSGKEEKKTGTSDAKDPFKLVSDFMELSEVRSANAKGQVRKACVDKLAHPLDTNPKAAEQVTGIAAASTEEWLDTFKARRDELRDEMPVLAYTAAQLTAQWKKEMSSSETASAAGTAALVCKI